MVQLFQNLIENSLKFKNPTIDPIIKITSEDLGDSWKFSVQDNGIGFHPKYAQRIFTMFQRLHPSGEFPGTGIGLAVCKKIVEFNGAKNGVTSNEGKGTTFYFTLPKKEKISSAPDLRDKNSSVIDFPEDSQGLSI